MRIWLSILLLALAMPARAADPAVVYANANGNAAKPYREGWFGTGDTKLHYVEAGQGPLILLVHGFPSFWFSWFDQMEALKGRYRVVAIDALGAGLSGKPQRLEPYRVENLAKQLDGLARHLNDKRRFVLVGHDWGAALAFAYAQAYPKRLNAVIGMSAPPYNIFLNLVRDSTDQQRRSTYMQTFRALTLADIEKRELAAQIWRQSYGGLIESGALSQAEGELFRAALSDPRAIDGGMNWYRANIPPFDRIGAQTYWPARNAKLDVPALLIWGEADATFAPEFIDRMRAQSRQLTVERLPGIGHWTSMQDPASTNAALTRFLERIERDDHVRRRD